MALTGEGAAVVWLATQGKHREAGHSFSKKLIEASESAEDDGSDPMENRRQVIARLDEQLAAGA